MFNEDGSKFYLANFMMNKFSVIDVAGATVQTYGAEPFMTIDPAREVAVMIDDRILGNTEAIEPTPIPPPIQTGSGS